ncbi:UNKNOWN [Stylonychia lemnae]|uniref:NadR/Ttd14 AAA domain-containing protein n=1 Tax=Stylonychia lemnae TaxID=5949 RepID=A0A078B2Y4_STYLE|nr:UNKNOWN [Stylonychia lemnae]|eukprot:CDW87597.1 UNKNOWN [Stylonychia lemnae]
MERQLKQQNGNVWFYLTIFISVAFVGLQILKHFSSKDQLAMKEAKLKQKLKKQIEKQQKHKEMEAKQVKKSQPSEGIRSRNVSTTDSNRGDNGGKKDKLATMNEEIERVERVMRKRNNSKLTAQTSAHEELGINRSTSSRGNELDSRKAIKDSKHPITRICLTGGPCAGKTTALATLSVVLQQMGFKVLQVPEAATILMKGGAFIETPKMTLANAVRFQINLMKLQMSLEDNFIQIAMNSDQPTIILCDRGVMDGSAYTEENVWQAILDETGWSTMQLRDRRYEAVIHLVTAAQGAEEFYTMTNNQARYEDLQAAQELDQKLINAWVGHPHFSIIQNNFSSFQQKIDSCLETVLKFIGLPSPSTFIKKFLLIADKNNYDIQVPRNVKKEYFNIEETFLLYTAEEQIDNVARKIGKNDSFIYYHETKTMQNNERIVRKRQITAREYIELLDQKDNAKKVIKKLRQCFIYESQYFIVDTFLNLKGFSFSIMRIETTREAQQIKIPPFVKVMREVTEEQIYETRMIADKQYMMPEKDKKEIEEKIKNIKTN